MSTIEQLDFSFTRPVRGEDLVPLLRQTFWASNRSAEQVDKALRHSPIVLGVWQGRKLVAFARALTDDTYRAVIDDVVVDEPLRGRGIGKAMLKKLLERLEHVEEVFLACRDSEVPFYEKLGLRRADNPYMKIRRS